MTTTTALFTHTMPVGPLQCNCTILGDPVSKKAIVIDPGGDADKIQAILSKQGFELVAAYHTHAHFDHFLASGELKRQTGCQLALHPEDRFLWDMLETQCGWMNIPYVPAPPPDLWLKDEDSLPFDGVALHTPGHTPGSTCFHFSRQKLLLGGDTLFQGSVGRTDLPGGDFEAITKSIRNRLYSLDEDTQVIAGHGASTLIGIEKETNAFVRAKN